MALVARRSETDLKHVLDQWSRITDTVGIRTLPDFLRHHLNSRQPFVRQERLFKAIKADVRTAEDVFALLDELERSAVLYQALQDPYDPYWADLPIAKEQVRILNLLGVKQFKSLALSTGRKVPDSLQDLLRFCMLISVRYTIIGDLNPSELERVYNEVAVAIERDTLRTSGQIQEALRQVSVSDEDFRDAFSRRSIATNGRSKKVVRYILCALERQLGHPDVRDETCAATIEHILPENLRNSWETTYSHDQHERFVQRLGNYTLLDPSRNRDLGNLSFSDKLAGYKNSGYRMTSRISASEWTLDLIEARQREMAGWAATVWQF